MLLARASSLAALRHHGERSDDVRDVVGVILLVTLVATISPARGAMRVDPARTLQELSRDEELKALK